MKDDKFNFIKQRTTVHKKDPIKWKDKPQTGRG